MWDNLSPSAIRTLLAMGEPGCHFRTFEAGDIQLSQALHLAVRLAQIGHDMEPYRELARHNLVIQHNQGVRVTFVLRECGRKAAERYRAK